MPNILLVEDDASFRELLSLHLQDRHYRVRAVASLCEARRAVAASRPDAMLLDYRLPDGDGLALLREIKAGHPSIRVIMITGMEDTVLAIETMKAGAYDFIRKPVDTAMLDATLARALDQRGPGGAIHLVLDAHAEALRGIVGRSRPIIEICKTIGLAAPTGTCINISGESGTGKEMVARAIHEHSGRSGAFLPINCAAIVETLLESELFGHEKGSFTGAVTHKPGKFELANDGTLFLDEIGELPLALQAKLLRVLQEGSFERVGGNRTLRTGARIIAASNQDLGDLVRAHRFREDLYYRLNVVSLHLPPLRDRPEDLLPLVAHLLGRINRDLGKNLCRVSEDAWRVLAGHSWPGNVRELENVLTRAAVLAQGDTLTPDLLELPEPCGPADAEATRRGEPASLDELEARHVHSVLERTHWHKGKACAILGISRPTLERKLRKNRADYRLD